MTSTLNAPVFEVKQDSEWYKYTKARLQREKEFFAELNKTFFEDNGFSYYHGEHFGVSGDSKDYEKYKDEVLKNPDRNGVHIFRKRSKYTAIFIEMMKGIDDKNPFKPHDVFGRNNLRASQWLGDRWFFGAKVADKVVGEEVEEIDYKEYLKLVMDSMDTDK
jgi:hypothetical protein